MSNQIARDVLKNMSVSDLLLVPFDQIEEAQSFVLPPEGAYILLVKAAGLATIGTGDNAKEAFTFNFAVDQTLGLIDATQSPVEAGAEFDVNFIGGQGVSFLKRDFLQVSTALNAANLQDFGQKLGNCKIQVLLTHRPDAKDPAKKYPTLQDITLV